MGLFKKSKDTVDYIKLRSNDDEDEEVFDDIDENLNEAQTSFIDLSLDERQGLLQDDENDEFENLSPSGMI